MSAEDDIFNAITRHQIFVLRYARGREEDAGRFIVRAAEEIVARLKRNDLTAFGRQRLQLQLRDMYEYLNSGWKEHAETLNKDLQDFSAYEGEFNGKLLEKHLQISTNYASPAQIQQAAFLEIMGLSPSRGYTLGGMIDDFGPSNATSVINQIRQGIVLGDTTQDMIKRVRDIIPTQKRKAATLVRTAVNHVATHARNQTMKENDDVLLGYEWVATLDGRTSIICASRDGVIYEDYDKDPKPPAHFNCRSTITPVVNPKYDLGADIVGKRPAVNDSGAKTVRADLTYGQWLSQQSEAFQNRVLGKTRANWFRKGMPLDRFVDNNGNILSLGELRQQDQEFNQIEVFVPKPVKSAKVRFDDINLSDIPSEKLSEYLDNRLTPELKKVALRTARPNRIISEGTGCWYQNRGKVLNQNWKNDDLETEYVFTHEYGHHIDSEFAPLKTDWQWSNSDKAFMQAFLDDRKELGFRATKTKKQAMELAHDELYRSFMAPAPASYSKNYGIKELKKYAARGNWQKMASDIIDAMTEGKFQKSGWGVWGHGPSYYRDKESRMAETFANLFAMRGHPEAWRYCTRKFPRLSKRFDEAIEEYLKSGVNNYNG